MLWFKFYWFKMFQTSLIIIFLCLIFITKSETKENKNQTGLNIFKPKINLNHNIYSTYTFGSDSTSSSFPESEPAEWLDGVLNKLVLGLSEEKTRTAINAYFLLVMFGSRKHPYPTPQNVFWV